MTLRIVSIAFTTLVALASPGSAQPGAPPPSGPAGPPSGPAGPPPGQPPGGGNYGRGYYYVPPPPPPRSGLTIGLGLGFGLMKGEDGLIDCRQCDTSPGAAGVDFHIGGMINPKLALLFDIGVTGQSLDDSGYNSLVQSAIMGALQFWVSDRFWLKGGLGVADLSISYDDGFYADNLDIDTGLAVMGAVGIEVVSTNNFAVDLKVRMTVGNYEGIDEQIHSVLFGVGLNFF